MLLELLSHTVLQDSRFRIGQDLASLGGSLPASVSRESGQGIAPLPCLSWRRWVSAPPLQTGKAGGSREKESILTCTFLLIICKRGGEIGAE